MMDLQREQRRRGLSLHLLRSSSRSTDERTGSASAVDLEANSRTRRYARARRTANLIVVLAIGLFVVVAFAYSLIVPPFETPDEPFHYAFARHLAQGNGLPVQDPEAGGPWHQEGSQAPLYYLLAGWLTAGVDQDDFPDLSRRNPMANIGDPLFPGNKNFMLYSAAKPPLQGSNLALHLGRWFSILLGAAALWLTYVTAKPAFIEDGDEQSRLLPAFAVLIMATIPQFAFIGMSFSNDSMILLTSVATVYWLVMLVARPSERPVRWWEWSVLGLLLGMAALSKLQGLGLFGLATVAGLMITWIRGAWRSIPGAVFLVAAPALLIAGWWYWRNVTLYDDWLGITYLLEINGRRARPLTWNRFWDEFRGIRYSFWGLFGWFNILLPSWFYGLVDAVAVVGLIGLSARFVRTAYARRLNLRRSHHQRVFLLLAVWALLTFVSLLYWTLQATGSQGRLVYPGISALLVLLVAGLAHWMSFLPRSMRLPAWLVLPAILLAGSLYTLLSLIPAAYRAPTPVADLPPHVFVTDVTYGDADPIQLLGVDTPDGERFRPGQVVPVTLYLQADSPLSADYPLFVQFLDETGTEVANLTTHPGWGRHPTSLWHPGVVYADTYLVPLNRKIDNRSPLLADVYIGFTGPEDKRGNDFQPIVARDGKGTAIKPFLAQVAISPLSPPEIDEFDLQPGGSRFGELIELAAFNYPQTIGAATGTTIPVTMLWEATGDPTANYTAFVHLLDAEGNRIGGYDRAPAADRFPTEYWRAGDRIVSEFTLTLPSDLAPGSYELWVGLYDAGAADAPRLPVTDAAGLVTRDAQVLLGEILIRE